MKWLIGAAVAAGVFFAIASLSPAQRTCACGGAGVDRDTAIAIAKRDTPLQQFVAIADSHELPFRHLITGRDDAGRMLVVWVSTQVTKRVYLDELLPAHRAMALAEAAGMDLGGSPTAVLGYREGEGETVYWRVSNGPQVVNIDATSGQVIATIGGVVSPAAHD